MGQPADINSGVSSTTLFTFEVFVKPRDAKPFQREGVVRAPDIELAFVLAKEAFTRRFTCTSLCVVDTRHILMSATTEGSQNVFDTIAQPRDSGQPVEPYEVFLLYKRGKQHVHGGSVNASSAAEALYSARSLDPQKTVLNVWTVRRSDIRFTQPGEEDLWSTLPEKKFRDAIEYKGGDRLKAFLDRKSSKL